MIIDPEKEFERELAVFEGEVNEAIQSFYAEQTIHNVARRDRQAFDIFNRHAAFWNLTARALQANALIAVGRIFDNDARSHGVLRLLRLGEEHRHIFSKDAIEKRRCSQGGEWTEEFMRGVYVPSARDFARLRRYVEKQRAIYEGQYKILRDKVYAHKERKDMTAAFASASIPALERLLVFLQQLHEALWDLFHNGRKPTLRPARRSARRIVKLPVGLYRNRAEQEWITRETKRFLEYVVAPRVGGSTSGATASNLSRAVS